MKTQDAIRFLKSIQKIVTAHNSEILTGLGIAGAVTSTIFAVKATPKAMRLIEKAEDHGIGLISKGDNDQNWTYRPLKTKEIVKVTWKCYIPAVTTGVFSIACIIGAQSVNARRTAALATAYKLSEKALSEFKESAAEVIGEEKLKEVKQKVAERKVEQVTDDESNAKVVISGDGDTWFLDAYSNTVFRSSKNELDAAANKLNRNMRDEMFISLSQFYDEIGLPCTALSDSVGWHIDKGYIDINLSEAVVKDGRAYVVMDFLIGPEPDFDKYY